jgi:Tfp pilus assembly protein PilV
MKKSFSLVEVLIAVALLSVAGLSLLQTKINTTHSLMLIQDRLEISQTGSILLSNINRELNREEKTLEEFTGKAYGLDDNEDDLEEFFSQNKYLYLQRKIDFLYFADEDEMNQDENYQDQQFKNDQASNNMQQGFLIEEIIIKDEHERATSIIHFSYGNDLEDQEEGVVSY